MASPPPNQDSDSSCSSDLTPLRAHYLKKSLVQLQFGRELDLLASTDVPGLSNLSLLGPPFSPIPKALAPSLPKGLDLPFLKYIFRQFVLTFPFMDAAPKNFYSEKVQPFVDAMVERNIASASSSSMLFDDLDGTAEQSARRKLISRIEKNMALFVGSATKLVEKEEVVRLTQTDLDRLERLRAKRAKKDKKNKDYFEVNIVGVKTVVDKGRMRTRAHEEFIIRTRRSRYHDTYVSRRYGDFRTLADELTKRYPEEDIPQPPAKDRSYVTVTTPSTPTYSEQIFDGVATGLSSAASYLYGGDADTPASPSSAHSQASSQSAHPAKLTREKNRLTLRSYLNTLLSSYTIASSPVLKSFLLSGYITLTPEELDDAKRREETDQVREEGRKRFAREIAGRVDGLREAVKSVKGDIMGPGGLTNIFATIKVTPNIKDLPDNYKAVIEWARISLASTVFHTFVASDDASQTLAGLKRIHGLMPYLLLKGALKITNPVAMIRSVLDLFLAQPFGNRSLLQRMFTSALTEEVRQLQAEIDLVQEKIDDPLICQKIKLFVHAPREIQGMFKGDAIEEFGSKEGKEGHTSRKMRMGLLLVILRSAEEPALNRPQMSRVARSWRAWCDWDKERQAKKGSASPSKAGGDPDTDDEDGPPNEDAWFFEDLRVLMGLYQQLREKEQLIALIFEGFTADLLKDIITIFYSPLAQVYRAANIADSLSDLQSFINDLIRTVEQIEELSTTDPGRTVQIFISLIQRHEQAFYDFVHKVHSKGQGLFDSLMRWVELFLTVMREGLGQPISLDFILPHAGTQERKDVMDEVDKVALYHYQLKVLYEDKLRKRFGRASSNDKESSGFGGSGVGKEADAEDEAARALVEGVIGEISFGELVKADAIDVAAEEDESSDEESSEYESGSDEESSSEYESGSEETTTDDESRRQKALPSVPAQHQERGRHGRHQSMADGSVKSSVPYAMRTQHRATGSMTSLRSPGGSTPPTPSSSTSTPRHQQPSRKRSLSLKAVKSMSSLLGRDKDKDREKRGGKATPPLPPLPPSVLNQPGGGRVSIDQSGSQRSSMDIRPPPPGKIATSPSLPPQQQQRQVTLDSQGGSVPPSPAPSTMSTSSYVTAVGSIAPSRASSFRIPSNPSNSTPPALPAVEDETTLAETPVRTSSPSMMEDADAPPVPSKDLPAPTPAQLNGLVASAAASRSPDPLTQSSVDTIKPRILNGTAVSSMPSTDSSTTVAPRSTSPVADSSSRTPPQPSSNTPAMDPEQVKKAVKRMKKKNGVVEHPELKHIPALLPIFVEIMRPSLAPRKRTM